MLAARNRVTTPHDFREVVRRGGRSGGPVLVAHVLVRADGPPQARAGMVVSKALGSAVTRNLVKRRLRHLVRERLDSLPEHSLVVVRALPAAAGASYAELGGELERCLDACVAKLAARQGPAQRQSAPATVTTLDPEAGR